MKNYFRVMLGRQSAYAQECFDGGFIGCNFTIMQDLSKKLPDEWRDFNRDFIPVFIKNNPEKTKIGAGLACGFLWTIAKGINVGDIILSPDGERSYRVGEVTGPYSYVGGTLAPHRRPVRWFPREIARDSMSVALKASTGSIGTVSKITKYSDEIEKLIGGQAVPALIATDEDVEDPAVFALEKHLEDFLVMNWAQTELGRDYDIFQDDGEVVGRQYPSDTGPIDILALSKDKKTLLVVELKKARATDVVVGQIQRYMGYVLSELAENGQQVKGVIIAQEDDLRLRQALRVTQNISFYKYQVSFKLIKA